jgi:hypothetical protein
VGTTKAKPFARSAKPSLPNHQKTRHLERSEAKSKDPRLFLLLPLHLLFFLSFLEEGIPQFLSKNLGHSDFIHDGNKLNSLANTASDTTPESNAMSKVRAVP